MLLSEVTSAVVEQLQNSGRFDVWRKRLHEEFLKNSTLKQLNEKTIEIVENSEIWNSKVESPSIAFNQLREEIYKSPIIKELKSAIQKILFSETKLSSDIAQDVKDIIKDLEKKKLLELESRPSELKKLQAELQQMIKDNPREPEKEDKTPHLRVRARIEKQHKTGQNRLLKNVARELFTSDDIDDSFEGDPNKRRRTPTSLIKNNQELERFKKAQRSKNNSKYKSKNDNGELVGANITSPISLSSATQINESQQVTRMVISQQANSPLLHQSVSQMTPNTSSEKPKKRDSNAQVCGAINSRGKPCQRRAGTCPYHSRQNTGP